MGKHIPDDIIFQEILPKVPCIYLLQFRCVSKPWRTLISSNPHFIKTHLRYWKTKTLGVITEPMDGQYRYHNEETKEEFDLKLNQLMNEKNSLLPFISCYGLLLVRCVDWVHAPALPYFYVCNPVTGQFTRLPSPPHWLNPSEIIYDEVTGKFKVVSWSRKEVCIFTLGDLGKNLSSWRFVPIPLGDNVMYARAVSANGHLYWVTIMSFVVCIMSLNIDTEEIKRVAIPEEFQYISPIVVEFEGALYAVLYAEEDFEKFVIWVLADWKNDIWKRVSKRSNAVLIYGPILSTIMFQRVGSY